MSRFVDDDDAYISVIEAAEVKHFDGSKSMSPQALAKKVFDPSEWNDELIDCTLPILALAAVKAALAQMRVMGLSPQRVKYEADKNCGTGSGGFKPGNSCARGGGSSYASQTKLDGIEDAKLKERVESTLSALHSSYGIKLSNVSLDEMDRDEFDNASAAQMYTFTIGRAGKKELTHNLVLDKNVWKTVDTLKEYQASLPDGYLADKSAAGMIRHEYAHALDKEHPNYRSLIADVYKEYKGKETISTYSGSSPKEMVAEAFSHYLRQGSLESTGLERLETVFKGWENGGKFRKAISSDRRESSLYSEHHGGTGPTSDFVESKQNGAQHFSRQFTHSTDNHEAPRFSGNVRDRGLSEDVKATTATEWLEDYDPDDEDMPDLLDTVFTTPFGLVSLRIATELPLWMREKIADHISETFSQDYWGDINQTTLKQIETFLKNGLQNGESIRTMAGNISSVLGGPSALSRARNIARTESGHALNGARSVVADSLLDEFPDLPMKKTWLSVLGSTTRAEHADLDGVPADKDGMWKLAGIKVRWPGDIVLPPEQRCNCQCTIVIDFGMDDKLSAELIDEYEQRIAEQEKSWKKFLENNPDYVAWVKNCGTGAGGFKPGNTCAKGGGGPITDAAGKYNPGVVGSKAGVDTSHWKKDTQLSQLALGTIAKMEQLAENGEWDKLQKMYTSTKAGKQGSYGWMKDKKEVILQAKQNLLNQHVEQVQAPAIPNSSPTEWKKIGGQLGTEKAGLYEFDGKKYYVKFPDDINRAKNELLAMKLYDMAGVGVKKGAMVEIDGKQGLATEWVEAEKLPWTPGDKNLARQDFAVHAWLNNRDAVGAGTENPKDNIRLDTKKGEFILLDAGGSLEYKGMGGSGKKDFGHEAVEWGTFRDPKVNPTMAEVFGGMTNDQLIQSAQKLSGISNEQIYKTVEQYGPGTQAERALLANKIVTRKENILSYAANLEAIHEASKKQEAAKTEVAKAETPAAVPGPSIIPPPPFLNNTKNTAGYIAKMQKIYEAGQHLAATGSLSELDKIPTKAGGFYGTKIHNYKMDVIGSAINGGKANPEHVIPEVPEAPKINTKLLPTVPVFKDAKFANINKQIAEAALLFAKNGDMDSLKGMSIPDSPKLKSYHSSLMANVSNQLNPPKPPKKLQETVQQISEKIKGSEFHEGLKKVGYWAVHKELGGVPDGIEPGVWNHDPPELWAAGTKAAVKAGVKGVAKTYTTGAYHSINQQMRSGNVAEGYGEMGVKIGKGIVKHGVELPPGQLLSRKHGSSNGFDINNLKPGMVVSDNTVLSTSADPDVWSGDVHWHMTIGPGVKGLPVKNFSAHKGEREVLLAPNQKILVTHIDTTVSYIKKVHAVILPTDANQCC